jgi:single-strand DNA-binding protein
MGSSLNKAQLIGRIGRDPEIRFTSGGQAVANFTIATDESFKDRAGEKQKKTEWHNVVVWGKAVESFVQPYLHKGDMVYVEGRLQTRSWEDKKNGGTRYTTEINVTDIKGLITGDKPAAAPATRSTTRATARPAPAQPQQSADADFESGSGPISDEDLPF